ncbi:cupin domain-containing protein [Flavisolibacter ginsenosidimutans]|uniref:Cupin domain-containing protein n=1 Tax=Flavisolibacter ginsenosidimutans TaxID=661481 RepID=A0A5B8UMP2_9BACT|nr:cupin domain-containing protein [Flavisolibacter ginsenosidimutans]QEC57469.1 cupin domain-containing protein [Flavisolibacter ginsenosidimutans]
MKVMLSSLLLLFVLAADAQTDSLPSAVYPWNKYPATQSNGRESRTILKGSTTDLARLNIHTSSLGAGQTNHPLQAYSDREEIILVKEGFLKVTINDSSKTLGPSSIVLIEAGDKQQFQNTSDKPAMYCVLTFTSTLPVNLLRGKEGGGSLIKDWNELTVKKTDKGESRLVFDRPSSMFTRFEIHATTLKPGVESHPTHTHRAEEMMILLAGNVTLNVGSEKQNVAAGDVMLLRPNVPHNVVNTGSEPCTYYAIKWYN